MIAPCNLAPMGKGRVRMVGPNGKISFCSDTAAALRAMAAIGFYRAADIIPGDAHEAPKPRGRRSTNKQHNDAGEA